MPVAKGESLLNSIMNPSIFQSAVGSSATGTNGEFISLGEALKLVPPFKGDKQEVLAFIGNVDTAFAVTNSEQAVTLYKFVLTRISGESRTAIGHRIWLTGWILRNFYRIPI